MENEETVVFLIWPRVFLFLMFLPQLALLGRDAGLRSEEDPANARLYLVGARTFGKSGSGYMAWYLDSRGIGKTDKYSLSCLRKWELFHRHHPDLLFASETFAETT